MSATYGSARASAAPQTIARWWADWPGRAACRRLAVGVSGGVDSVVLLHALRSILAGCKTELCVVHLDHGLRGAAGAADRRFVIRLARGLGLRYRTARVDTRGRARRTGESVEMAARSLRYAFYDRAAQALGAQAVAVGHTADDQAETLLLRLARGTGPGGLGGMAPDTVQGGVRIVRPLLGASRAEVLAYAHAQRLRWREDATNRDAGPLRNRVRLEILPLIRQQINPSAADALSRTAAWLREEHLYLEALADEARAHCRLAPGELSATRMGRLAPCLRRRIWRQFFVEGGVPGARIDAALIEAADRLTLRSAGSQWLPVCGMLRLERLYDRLRLTADRCAQPLRGFDIVVPGVSGGPQQGWRVTTAWRTGFVRQREKGLPPAEAVCRLSGKMLRGRPLRLRTWRPGDRLAPLGMAGSKKIQDIMGEARVPRSDRSAIPVVVSGSDVVWLPGYRIARAWAVPSPRARALELVLEQLGPVQTRVGRGKNRQGARRGGRADEEIMSGRGERE